MDKYLINGGKRLEGEVSVQSAKNAMLPLLAASLLSDGKVAIERCPMISDVLNMADILRGLGCTVDFSGGSVVISVENADSYEIPSELAKVVRSSIFMLGPVLGRFRRAKVAYPGGCDIGLRPIDQHLMGLRKLGVEIEEENGYINCKADNLRGAEIHLDCPSVGATENIMMLAVLAEGRTLIHNAAQEPEIEDLQNFLSAMGAKIAGAGENTVEITGVEKLKGVTYTPVPDRIEAGTLLLAAAMTGGEIALTGCREEHISSLIHKLRDSACKFDINRDKIYMTAPRRPRSVRRVETMPYPGFPTDLQAQFLAFSSVAKGTSVIVENLFETRFKHVQELRKMGADIVVKDRTAVVTGVPRLHGADVVAHDLRGGAALVLAGLAAEGSTSVSDIHHIDRGYENFEGKLRSLGADIRRT